MSIRVPKGSLLCAALVVAGCGETIPVLDGAPCPCIAAEFCCPTSRICAPRPDACPAVAGLDRVEPARGSTGGGYALTAYGFGLDEAVEVFVGERPCPLLTQAPTSLSCAVPPGPPSGGPARVELRWEGRLESALDDHFAYARPSFIERGAELGVVSAQTGPAVSIADIDLDGRPDLAFPSMGPFQAGFVETTPTILLQRDDAFTELPLDVSFRQQAILPADLFGRDGIPELIYSSNVTHTLEVVSRTSTLSSYSVLGRLRGDQGMLDFAPVPVDLDGDGDLDLVGCLNDLRTDDYVVRVVVNEGSASLRVAPELVVGFEFTDLQCGVTNVADLDLDGRPEFIFCGDAVVVGAIDGEGRVRLAERYILDLGVVPDCRTAVARDLDLDGDVDLALAYQGELLVSDRSDRVDIPSGIRIFSSPRSELGDLELAEEGLREVEDSPTPTCTSPGSQRSDAALSMGVGAALWLDADLDGDEDLLLPTPSGHCALGPGLYLNLADRGEFGFSYMSIGGPILPDAPGGAVGDLDGDGDLDAVVANGGAGRRAVFLSQARSGRASDHHFVTIAPITDSDGDATDSDLRDNRPAWTVAVHLDLDGDDFEVDASLRSRVTGDGRSNRSHGHPEVVFGLGDRTEPVFVRVFFADGSIATGQVEVDQRHEVFDCAETDCPIP